MKRFMKPVKSSIRLQDIADACGLGLSTVSSALNGTGTISNNTRAMIIDCAQKLGYKPNLQASALARRRYDTNNANELVSIAVFHGCDKGEIEEWTTTTNQFQPTPLIKNIALTYYDVRAYPNASRLGKILFQRGVQGILLSRMWEIPDMSGFPWDHFCVVHESGRCLSQWPFDQIRSSPSNDIRYLLRLAWERGYRRPGVALFTHVEDIDDDEARLGEALAFNYLRVPQDPIPPYSHHFTFTHSVVKAHEAALMGWFNKYRPDCVIGFNNSFYHVLKTHGTQIPDEVGFLSSNIIPNSSWDQGLAGLKNYQSSIRVHALERLCFLINYNRKGIPAQRLSLILDPEYIEGRTIRQESCPE